MSVKSEEGEQTSVAREQIEQAEGKPVYCKECYSKHKKF